MSDLEIKYGRSDLAKYVGLFISLLFLLVMGANATQRYMGNNTDVVFIGYALCTLLALAQLISYSAINKQSVITIDNEKLDINIVGLKHLDIEWVTVSSVTMTPSYIIFHTHGGQKQRQLAFATMRYEDVGVVKEKVIELCKFKSISIGDE